MAYPPNTLPTNATDGTSASDTTPTAVLTAAEVNATNAAVNDIVAELGSNPSGTDATVAARLDGIESDITSLGSGSIPDGSVSTAKLADGAVTAAKVAADVATQAELDAETAARTAAIAGLSGTYAPKVADWATGAAYVVGQLVANAGTLYRCTTAHTAGGSFTAGNFSALGGGSTVTIDADGTLIVNGTTVEVATDADVASAIAAAVATKANTASPTFTGIPHAPTAAAGTSTTQLATTAFVQTAVGATVYAASVTGAATIDPANGAVQKLTLTGNVTVSLAAAGAGAVSLTLILVQDATGGRTVTWPGSVDWGASGAPTLSTAGDADDVVTLLTVDGGVKWFGFATSAAAPAGGGITYAGAKAFVDINQSVVSGSVSACQMNAEEWDTDGFHDVAANNSRFTIPAGLAGRYRLTGTISFASNATGSRQARWRKNGGDVLIVTQAASQTLTTVVQVVAETTAVAGDYFELCVWHDVGSAIGATWTGSIQRISA